MTDRLAVAKAAMKKIREIQDAYREHERKVKRLKAAEKKLINEFIAPLLADNGDLKNLSTKEAVALRVEREQFKIEDREQFDNWLADSIRNGDTSVLEAFGQTVLKGYMQQYQEEHESLPPGITLVQWDEYRVKAQPGNK